MTFHKSPESGASPEHHEKIKNIITAAPPAESLLHLENPDSPWPEEIKDNKEIKEQAELRLSLARELEQIFEHIPNPTMDISEAVNSGLVSDNEAAKIYESLSDFLKDPANGRIILYLPFELIPSNNWKPKSGHLEKAAKQFREIYLQKWQSLLPAHDIRANFVDGDIPEEEIRTGPLPKVSKAAHLIPKILEKQLISVDQIIELMESSSDQVLRNSIADALPVAADMGLISPEDIENILQSSDTLVRNLGIIINSNLKHPANSEIKQNFSLNQIISDLDKDFKKIESWSEHAALPEARVAWEKISRWQLAVKKHADNLALAIKTGQTNETEIKQLLSSSIDSVHTNLIIEGIGKAVEQSGEQLSKIYGSILRDLWNKNEGNNQEILTKIWSHWSALGILDADYLKQFDITVPKLDASFSERQSEIEPELLNLSEAIKSIETDPELSKFLYPVAILYGSRVKGYAAKTADLDIAVFVKPGTSMEDRQKMRELMLKEFNNDDLKGRAMEFWLAKNTDGLYIQDFPELDNALGDSTLAHVLFEGVWYGKDEVIKELYKKLLVNYLHSKNKTVLGQNARELWLSEIERDTLQYRLMHKGYERFFPEQGGINTPHSGDIDSNSVFYDSGYRRLATKLFVKKVFLPQI